MGKEKKQFQRTLLIVCEGTKTEPHYFNYLREIALEKNVWDNIEISPLPTFKVEIIQKNTAQNNRKTRKFKPNIEIDNEFIDYLKEIYSEGEANEIYQGNKQIPVRYVSEAKEKLKNEGFNEAWAVFDEDDREVNLLKKAFDLKSEHENLHIAFSSRSFEYWILLHFEQINKAFQKTECKTKDANGNDIMLNCGILDNQNSQNCQGNICIIGFIRQNHYQDFAKSQNRANLNVMMQKLIPLHKIAFENASFLRFQVKNTNPNRPIYALKPYTDEDLLVKNILQISYGFTHITFEQEIDFAGMESVKLSKINNTEIQFSAKKINVNPNFVDIYSIDIDKNKIKHQIIEDFSNIISNNKFIFKIENTSEITKIYIEIAEKTLVLVF